MNLSERIERRQPDPKVVPLTERRVPEWLRRQQEGRLPNKDTTGSVVAA